MPMNELQQKYSKACKQNENGDYLLYLRIQPPYLPREQEVNTVLMNAPFWGLKKRLTNGRKK